MESLDELTTHEPTPDHEGRSLASRLLSQEEQVSKFDRWIEFLSAIVLALATVATAWCGYQASQWSGDQTNHMAAANDAHVEAARLSNEATQYKSLHASLFVAWAAAVSQDNTRLSDFLFQRFPGPLKTASEAWLATKPLQNPDAPASPFDMPEYVLPQNEQARQLEQTASKESEMADTANEASDHYVLLTVIFASVLFFGGISGKFQSQIIDLAMLAVAALVFVTGLGVMLTFPIQ